MSDLELRARSTSEIVDAAIQLYRRDPSRYMLLTALAYAPWVVLQLVVLGTASDAEKMFSPAGMLTWVGMFLGFATMSAVLARLAASAYMGEHLETAATIREVLPRVPAIIATTLVKYFAFMLGLMALVIPGLYVITRWFATTQAIILEDAGVGAAFRRSSVLSKGLKRHIFNTIALVWIIYMIASFAVTMLTALGGELVMTVASTLFVVVAYPVIGITEVLLYYDTRVRKEGYDIEVMTQALDRTPAPVA